MPMIWQGGLSKTGRTPSMRESIRNADTTNAGKRKIASYLFKALHGGKAQMNNRKNTITTPYLNRKDTYTLAPMLLQKERKKMGVHTWAYESEKCDGDYCPCNCDICPKSRGSEHLSFNAIFNAFFGQSLDEWKNEQLNKSKENPKGE